MYNQTPSFETTIVVKGIDELASNLSRYSRKVVAAYDRVLRAIVRSFSVKAEMYAPIDTGALRASLLQGGMYNIHTKSGRHSVTFGTGLPYAAVQEYSDHFVHRKGGQAHYMRQALIDTRNNANQIGQRILSEVFR